MKPKYPTRARILDVTGETWRGIGIATPSESKSHVGKEGVAERLRNGDVKLTLDDGTILWGWDCWWKPIS